MPKCVECGEDDDYHYKCNYCGHLHCKSHRLPENHDCANLGAPIIVERTPIAQKRSGPEPMDPADVGLRPPKRPEAETKATVESEVASAPVETKTNDRNSRRVSDSKRSSSNSGTDSDTGLLGQRIKWRFFRLIQLAGFGMTFAGIFLFFRRVSIAFWSVGPPLSTLPQSWFIQSVLGNIVLMLVGMIVVWQST